MNWRPNGGEPLGKGIVIAAVAVAGMLFAGLLVVPVLVFGSGAFSQFSGNACSAAQGQGTQPAASPGATNSIPANYLRLFKSTGAKTGVPWVILAGIAKVESNDGRTTLPGVHSGSNAFGAAGPMQIGIDGASGNSWGGAPIHPASEQVSGVASDGDGNGVDDVYDPADAILGAAKYLLEHGVLDNANDAIFAYNHLESYVQTVLMYAGQYAKGGFSVSPVTLDAAPSCLPGVGETVAGGPPHTPATIVTTVISYAEAQLGKPYLFGGTGPDAFDCSGLVLMAYRQADIFLPRTTQEMWAQAQKLHQTYSDMSQAEPGDLVFFAGSDGTTQSPGHVGMVIGGGKMIEAYATGFPIRIAPYAGRSPIGFIRPWLETRHLVTAAHQTRS